MAWWLAYDAYEPLGQAPDRYLLAGLVSLMYNVNRDRSKTTPSGPEDFMPGRRWQQTYDPASAMQKQQAMFIAIQASQEARAAAKEAAKGGAD